MAWRIPSILQGGLPIVQLCFLWLIPESPRWLVSKGRNEAAHTILRRFHDPTPDSPLVSFEMSEIIESIHKEKEAENTSWKALVSKPGNRKRTLIAVIVGWFAQWNGVAVVSYYLPLVLDSVGITSSFDQTLINGALQIFNFVAALGAAFLVDRLGRRTLFLWSTTGMLVSYIVWTACSAVTMETGNKAAGTVVVCVFVVYFHYDIAWTPLLYGYPTEIFPFSLRAKGLATEFFFNLAALVLASFVNPIGIANESWRYYIVFCCLLLFILCLIYFLFPETKGHSLEEIAVLFDGDDGQVSPLAEKGEEADHKERV